MDELSHADKAVLLLYLDDVGYDEMALILGATAGSLRVRFHRIKKRLTELCRSGNSMSLEEIKREWRDQMECSIPTSDLDALANDVQRRCTGWSVKSAGVTSARSSRPCWLSEFPAPCGRSIARHP